MASITFDTLELVDKLKSAGIPQERAEAVVRVIAETLETLVTKDYLDNRLDKVLAPIYTDLVVLKWMMVVLLAGQLRISI